MPRWKFSALAAAAFVSAAMTSTNTWALALGPISVQSALGENLRAEIAIAQFTAAELDTLTSQIASADIFRAQGMDFSNAARSIQVQVLRKPDGTAALQLSSTSPIRDPFVDVVLLNAWNTGNMVRSYTLLLDPPANQRAVTTSAPQVAPAPATTARSYTSAPTTAPAPAARTMAPPPASSDASGDSVRVRSGETAGAIAKQHGYSGVSLDQMLVAMLRSNPNAFINGNVNRIRAGAVVQLPSREQALETSANEARQMVMAQSRDFNAFRRSLAAKAPAATVQAADRSASGQIQARVDDSSASADTPDKLTLSKGSVQNAAPEAALASQKQTEDQSNRLNELQRNLAELNELTQTTQTPVAAPTSAAGTDAPTATQSEAPADSGLPSVEVPVSTLAEPAADAPIGAVVNPVDAAAAQSAALTSDTATGDTATTTSNEVVPAEEAAPEALAEANPAPAPEPQVAPAEPKAPAPAPAPAPIVAEPSLMDTLQENPLLPAGGAVAALLLGLLGYRSWKRKKENAVAPDPSMGDSQLQPESFFGGSGGQQVDTNSDDAGASTMAYSPSQLNEGGDVDPVAEADVYLAYGRDVQAEEILKEAQRLHPERLSVHVKLAEIYVKRQDIKALEATAQAMQAAHHDSSPEWQRVMEMGRNMDPTHPFFASAGSVHLNAKPGSFTDALQAATPAAATAALGSLDGLQLDIPDAAQPAQAAPIQTPAMPQPSESDFAALDFSASPAPQDPPTLVADTVMQEDLSSNDLQGLDLDLSSFNVPAVEAAPAAAPEITTIEGLDFDLGGETPAVPSLDSLPTADAEAPTPVTPATPAAANFDLGSLDLDLGSVDAPAPTAQDVHNLADDPLSTKLDLAQEFNTIGDSEGARALIEEVLAEASGPLKDRAQKMLSEID